MADVRNCKRCGKVFGFSGGSPICTDCKNNDEKDFKRVKEFLYDNPGAGLGIVSATLDVSVEKIKRFLRDGRLEITGGEGNLILECDSCGKSINSGRYCDGCSRGLTKELQSTSNSMSQSMKPDESEKKAVGMRYLNKEIRNK